MEEKFIQAGKIAAEALQYGKGLVKVGASLLEVSDKIEAKIKELGGELAFPVQISLNEIAAHYCALPDDKTVFKEGDLVKIDLGVHIDGYVSDTALSVDLGGNEELIKASQEALNEALKIVKPGVKTSEIGKVIAQTIEGFGFKPVKNLSGHGIGRFVVHGPPSIPNFDTQEDIVLEDGMTIAIEPFASDGAGMIYEASDSEIFMLTGKKATRSLFTREILKEIETYNGLPFTTRWLTKKFGVPKVNFALRELDNLGILRKFPPLPDKNNGKVSQAEHSIIVKDKPIVFTRL